ncbi:phosphoadenosine phosphosulfate reductase family protein [Deefgea piscis]|uniref:phosphoadenosine phosphosulfate reductase family protein n=1 Tax=Deefgea piscis TaxID=2739061 RepID=UPI001C820A84|nr:phosphoadenosine phosphosulfate reductase family protein [Deefgea piscis]QZA80219.1 phosphoadenosine phosphosulfate reductase family protein [Deefgea piscis]
MVKIPVPISGGKDSQTCLELAIELVGVGHVQGLFCDTKFEHPLTYEHIDFIRDHYRVQIDVVNAGNVPDKVRKYGRFPGGGARFCTDELKIKPTVIYAKALATAQGGFEIWYGMRSDESTDRAARYKDRVSDELYTPHEYMAGKYPKYLARMGVMVRLPILDWSKHQVLHQLQDRANPLYAAGFDRVGCFPCFASGDVHKERAFGFDKFGKQQKVIALQLEREIGKSIWTSQGGSQRNNPDQMCMICQS